MIEGVGVNWVCLRRCLWMCAVQGEDEDSNDSLRDPKKDFQHVTFWQYLFGK